MEFGARRAHNFDAADYGARAAYIGGVAGNGHDLCRQRNMAFRPWERWHIPSSRALTREYEAFLNYAQTYPDSCTVLLDTYNTLKSGLPNAIRVAKEYLEPNGYRLQRRSDRQRRYGLSFQEDPQGSWMRPACRTARSSFPTRWMSF